MPLTANNRIDPALLTAIKRCDKTHIH